MIKCKNNMCIEYRETIDNNCYLSSEVIRTCCKYISTRPKNITKEILANIIVKLQSSIINESNCANDYQKGRDYGLGISLDIVINEKDIIMGLDYPWVILGYKKTEGLNKYNKNE